MTQTIARSVFHSDVLPNPSASNTPYAWILHPVLDWMLCCGGLIWLIFIAISLGVGVNLTSPSGVAMWLLWIVGVHILNYSHSTFAWRKVITHGPTRRSIGPYLAISAGVCVAAMCATVAVPSLMVIMARVYTLFAVQHFLGQSYGVVLIYCMKRKYSLNATEKRIVNLVHQSLLWFIWLRAFSDPTYGAYEYIGVKVPFWGLVPGWACLLSQVIFGLTLLAFVGMIVVKYIKQRILFPLPALVSIVTTLCLFLFSLYVYKNAFMGFFIGAFYHGSQNLAIAIAQYLKEKGLPEGVSTSQISTLLMTRTSILFLLFCVFVGEVIFVILPRLITLIGVDLQVAMVAVFTTFGIHHILTEGAMYKLRDPAMRKLLVD